MSGPQKAFVALVVFCMAAVVYGQGAITNQQNFFRALRNDNGAGFMCASTQCGIQVGFGQFSQGIAATGDISGGSLSTPGPITAASMATGAFSATDITASTVTASGAISGATGSLNSLTLAAQPLPTCSNTTRGQLVYNSADGQHYGCGVNGWSLITNVAAAVFPIATSRTTYSVPTSLGVLGVGGTSTAVVTLADTPAGADCLITCPAAVLGKVVWQCLVATANTATVVATSTTALTITLPSAQTCSVRALWSPQ